MRLALLFGLLVLPSLAGACGAQAPAADLASASPCGDGKSVRAAVGAELPKLTGRVVDQANLLPETTETQLTDELRALEQATSDQLVVVTTPSLNGEPIERFGLRLGNGWGIGQEKLDNGVLLIVAPNERRVRIEVGCGLEGLLTDARAQEIIDARLIPLFRQGDYSGAVEEGVAEISQTLLNNRRRPMASPGG